MNSTSSGAHSVEPRANWRSVPVWLLILILLVVYWSMLFFEQHGGWFSQEVYFPFRSEAELASYQPDSRDRDYLPGGKKVYEKACAICHNKDGTGKLNQAPPLAGSEWVVDAPARLIRIPLYGLNGPITVQGQQMVFPAGMPAVGSALSEDELAAALTYIRQTWGNNASRVTPEQIRAVKVEVGNRSEGFTEEGIKRVSEK